MDNPKETKGNTGGGVIDILEQFARRFSDILSYVAVLLLLLMTFLTCFNVIVRVVALLLRMLLLTGFSLVVRALSIVGIYEITGYLGSAVVAFAIAYTQLTGGHIAIDWLVTRLSGRTQAVVKSVALLTSAALFVLLAWQSFRFAGELWLNGEVSPTQKIPFFPFVYGVALGCVPVALLLIVDFVKSVAKVVRK